MALKEYRVSLVIRKEITKNVKAESERRAIQKAKALVRSKPPKIGKHDFLYPEADEIVSNS